MPKQPAATPHEHTPERWEEEFDNNFLDTEGWWYKTSPEQVKYFIAHQRQQAVAEFAREAVERSLNSVVNGKVVRLADIRTLLEQRGIELN